MNLNLKRMPASEADYRLLFSPTVGARPTEMRITGSDNLRQFLTDLLEVPAAAASRTVVELESGGTSWMEGLPCTADELKLAVKTYQVQQQKAG